ncbi:unnamed protein product [Colias eurytheme]|nr:unnamed protein product [Colias eurytheme]
MSNSSIMSIREMIDTAFGESDVNVVNFKLIQTVLYILARQLRVLERRVQLTIQPSVYPSSSGLSISEVKIKASMPKKKKNIKAPAPSQEKSLSKPMPGQAKSKPETLKTTIDLTSSSKTISDPTKSSASKSSSSKTETTKTTTDLSSSTKTTTEPTESSTSKTTSDFTKTSTEKSSSSKTTSDFTKTSTLLSSSSKTTSDQTKTSTEKSSSSKTTTEPTKTSTEKSSTEMSSSLKTSTEMSSTDKSSSSKSKSTSDKPTSDERKKKEFHNMLQIIEEQREREIRTIHQRANSKEEAARSPTPMASLDTMETQYEKLLIVERVPSDATKTTKERKKSHTPQVSVVTQEQFENLAIAVREIQNKFGAIGKATFPENPQLMQELRRGASLTNAMAALQLSARLEAAEKALDLMMELVTEMAMKKGININFETKQQGTAETPETKVVFEANNTESQEHPSQSQKHRTITKTSDVKSRDKVSSIQMSKSATSTFGLETSLDARVEEATERSVEPAEEQTIEIELKPSIQKPTNLIKPMDLEQAMKEMYDGMMKAVNNITNKTSATAENALKTSNRLEAKLEAALNLGDRMDNLDALVSEYVEQINIMDTNLSSQMTNYQEQLTQMQHDLESGLENMAEAMANTGGDTVAVAELNAHFTDLQVDFDNTNTRQKELKEYQDCLSLDLQALLKQIEILRETKSDREEVADALRDKAGLGALNGLVTLQQFNAVRGDFEKRIGAAYDKFNNQEIIWQKAIDDLLRELNEKADLVQVMCLRDDVNNNLDKLNSRLHTMMEIVGEPRAAAVAKRLFRNTACLSCNTPANMEIEEPGLIPALPAFPKTSKRPPTIGAEGDSNKNKEDIKVCYPGQPIQHPIDERAQICTRYCGGSHTAVPNTLGRAPGGMIVTSMPRDLATGVGSDGKVYIIDENNKIRKPCVPCNQPYVTIPQPSEADQAPTETSDMVPWDFMQAFEPDITEDVTPPPPTDDLD